MAQVLSLSHPTLTRTLHHDHHRQGSERTSATLCHSSTVNQSWASLQHSLKCRSRFSCLFSNNGKQEQARKALESALGGKKTEFEKWDKEIKRREEAGGGGDSGGGGGWFRWGGWFGGSDGDRFWQEAQQTSLTIIGIIAIYLIIAKGDVMLAVVFNPLLFALRGTRNGLTFLTSKILKVVNPNIYSKPQTISEEEVGTRFSAKESVVSKWRSN